MKGVRTCLSGLTPENVAHISDVKKIAKIDHNDMDPTIVVPNQYYDWRLSSYVLAKEDWNLERFNRTSLERILRWDKQKAQCFWRKIDGVDGMEEIEQLISYPTIRKQFNPPQITCQKSPNPSYAQTFYQTDTGNIQIPLPFFIFLCFSFIYNYFL